MAITGLFVLYHNHICHEVKKTFVDLDDDKLFEECRRRNVAIYQNIIINEFMSQELGIDIGPY
jgi:hypothetical protein